MIGKAHAVLIRKVLDQRNLTTPRPAQWLSELLLGRQSLIGWPIQNSVGNESGYSWRQTISWQQGESS